MENKFKLKKSVRITAIVFIALITVLTAILFVGCGKDNSNDSTSDTKSVAESGTETDDKTASSSSDTSQGEIPKETEYVEAEAKIIVDEEKKADDKFVKEDVYTEEKDENSGSTIELKYPVAQASEYGEAADEYNELIQDFIDVIVEQYKALLPTADAAYSFKSDYEIYYKDEGYLSSIIKINISDGSDNVTVYSSYNYDMNNKKQLFDSPYVDCSDFDNTAKKLIKFDIEQRPSDYFSDVVENFSSYYQYAKMVFDKDSVKFIYEPDYIAERSKGEIVFSYDNSKFED